MRSSANAVSFLLHVGCMLTPILQRIFHWWRRLDLGQISRQLALDIVTNIALCVVVLDPTAFAVLTRGISLYI
jgi:hypothetical protein